MSDFNQDEQKEQNIDEQERTDGQSFTEQEQPEAESAQQEENQEQESAQAEYTYEWREGAPQQPEHAARPVKVKKVREKKSNRGLQIFAAVITTVCILSLMVLSYVLVGMINEPQGDASGTYSNPESTSRAAVEQVVSVSGKSGGELTLNEIYKKMENSCVSILSEFTSGSGYLKKTGTSLGSGFIITEDGYIVTNHHVIEDTTKLTVIMYDGTKYPAELVASRADCDIAVLKIKGTFTPVEIGSSNDLEVGDFVCAIGTPSDLEFAGTMTYGIISSNNRTVSITNSSGVVIKTMKLLQTDATLNPGNSGGPLINMYGQVVGINTLKLTTEYEGIAFSIPMSEAIDIINALIAGEDPDTTTISKSAPYLGITTQNVTEETASHYNVPQGILVYQIESSGSAYKAGLRRGDIITEFEGKTVLTATELSSFINTKQAGDTITIKVYRDDSYHELTFKLDARTE